MMLYMMYECDIQTQDSMFSVGCIILSTGNIPDIVCTHFPKIQFDTFGTFQIKNQVFCGFEQCLGAQREFLL